MVKVSLERVNQKSIKNIEKLANKVAKINQMIDDKSGLGSDFLGWTSYANELSDADLKKIKEAAKRISDNCDVLVAIGIGGSYLGAKAAIDAINGVVNKSKCEIIFLGNTLSPTYTAQVLKYLEGKKVGINVISKSGTTTEPAIAFRLVLDYVKKCWGDEYAKYVIATTDKLRGALRQIAIQEGFEMFYIPDDVGGRYSVFSPVGLLPMAVAGLNIDEFVKGAKDAIKEYALGTLNNPAYTYAALRYVENKKNKNIEEYLISWEPQFQMLAEWWKQLFGESEGKDHKGLVPGSLCFTTDLHSMGQFCQDGTPCFFETTLHVDNYQDDICVPHMEDDLDNLGYLEGKSMSSINEVAIKSTMDAHFIEGKHDNIRIDIAKMDEYNLGNLMYFFCKACAMSAYMIDVNPFNQPGVEIYKIRMKNLLKKL